MKLIQRLKCFLKRHKYIFPTLTFYENLSFTKIVISMDPAVETCATCGKIKNETNKL